MKVRTSLFDCDHRQAVPLPAPVAFPTTVAEVDIIEDGSRRILVPASGVWDDVFDSPGINVPDRDQPGAQERAAS